jgi:hypothetical protein
MLKLANALESNWAPHDYLAAAMAEPLKPYRVSTEQFTSDRLEGKHCVP